MQAYLALVLLASPFHDPSLEPEMAIPKGGGILRSLTGPVKAMLVEYGISEGLTANFRDYDATNKDKLPLPENLRTRGFGFAYLYVEATIETSLHIVLARNKHTKLCGVESGSEITFKDNRSTCIKNLGKALNLAWIEKPPDPYAYTFDNRHKIPPGPKARRWIPVRLDRLGKRGELRIDGRGMEGRISLRKGKTYSWQKIEKKLTPKLLNLEKVDLVGFEELSRDAQLTIEVTKGAKRCKKDHTQRPIVLRFNRPRSKVDLCPGATYRLSLDRPDLRRLLTYHPFSFDKDAYVKEINYRDFKKPDASDFKLVRVTTVWDVSKRAESLVWRWKNGETPCWQANDYRAKTPVESLPGKLVHRLCPGTYDLRLIVPGYTPCRHDDVKIERSRPIPPCELKPNPVEPVTLSLSQTVPNGIKVEVSRSGNRPSACQHPDPEVIVLSAGARRVKLCPGQFGWEVKYTAQGRAYAVDAETGDLWLRQDRTVPLGSIERAYKLEVSISKLLDRDRGQFSVLRKNGSKKQLSKHRYSSKWSLRKAPHGDLMFRPREGSPTLRLNLSAHRHKRAVSLKVGVLGCDGMDELAACFRRQERRKVARPMLLMMGGLSLLYGGWQGAQAQGTLETHQQLFRAREDLPRQAELANQFNVLALQAGVAGGLGLTGLLWGALMDNQPVRLCRGGTADCPTQ